MSERLRQRIANFNAVVESIEILLSPARDSTLQNNAMQEIISRLDEVSSWKREAVKEGNEDEANSYLGMECVGKSLEAELDMWLLLKADKPEQAWDRLIDAQQAARNATRAHPGFEHLAETTSRLEAIEKLIFPPQVFMSAGLLVEERRCSICGVDYDDCEHLVGQPYMGELCHRKITKFHIDHVSIVTDPANKRCRVTHFSVEGGNRNRMTWRVEPAISKGDSEQGLECQGRIISVGDLDC